MQRHAASFQMQRHFIFHVVIVIIILLLLFIPIRPAV